MTEANVCCNWILLYILPFPDYIGKYTRPWESFLDELRGPCPYLVSVRTTIPTTISLPDSALSQEHKFLSSLLTCDFNMQQLSKGH